ncbi:hypothetical protein BGW36DRAFT_415423 [Talaromyces proteolyticus]|uniref:FAD-binding domain-containing protein n=1 Tax=Talaromyces proteolyticus TaxID=1131652 RepID=A0AAD4KW52_9EURO|nr:uncharacterized protein BGW36DRAFT_415423 [Talaromyces proteolyticus]KAH8700322.1 hypothetical protein BGW36DRAFT_415423 [Talaromyces proteolyticus]
MAKNQSATANASVFETPTYPTNCLYFLQDHMQVRIPPSPNRKSQLLDIVIVGAGLGGLATAIALAQSGHRVKVYEQASVLGEVGAGIQIPSNSMRLLAELGLEPYLKDHATEPKAIYFRRWQNGKTIGMTKLIPEFRQTYNAPYYVIHRADFHSALHKRALDVGVEIKLGSRAVSYNADTSTITFENGSVVTADLIVAADGVKSLARKVVLGGHDKVPQKTGFAAYRSTVKVERMQQDPELDSLLTEPALNIWVGDGRHVMTYKIGAGKTFNLVLSHPDNSDPREWDQSKALDEMRAEFRGWDTKLTKVINLIDKTIKWPLLSGSKLDQWVSERLVLLGDAAHAMVPYMSQGAAMAVEDGVALAHSLSKVHDSRDISKALSIYQSVRTIRSSQMQEASLLNGQLWHFPDGPLQEARDLAMYPETVSRPFVHSPNQWSDPTTQLWCYGYDTKKAVEEEWEKRIANGF